MVRIGDGEALTLLEYPYPPDPNLTPWPPSTTAPSNAQLVVALQPGGTMDQTQPAAQPSTLDSFTSILPTITVGQTQLPWWSWLVLGWVVLKR